MERLETRRAALLTGCPGLPPLWQQIIFFDLLILAAGLAAARLVSGQGWRKGGRQ